jgi:hypothetical protein
MRFILYFITLIGAIIFTACGEGETTEPASLQSAEIKDVMQFDENSAETSDPDVFLSTPYLTVTDADGRIYIQDASLDKFFVFNEAGEFQNVFGGKGRGPGEFESIYDMAMLDNSRLLVYDYMSKRATIFDADLKVEKTLNMNYNSSISDVIPFSENEILLSNFSDGHLIQIYNLDEQEITGQIIPTKEILTTNDEAEENFLESTEGYVVRVSEDLIAFTPEYYSGKMYLYERVDTVWTQKSAISGYENIDKPFSIHETTSEPHERAMLISINPEGGYYGYEYHSHSQGLFKLEGNRFAHISYRDANPEKTELRFIYEIFDAETGQLEKAAEIDSLRTVFPPERIPVHVDNEGFLFVADITDGYKLRKIEVLW